MPVPTPAYGARCDKIQLPET